VTSCSAVYWDPDFVTELEALIGKHARRLWALTKDPGRPLYAIASLDLKLVHPAGHGCGGDLTMTVVVPELAQHCGAKRDCRPAPCICKCDPCVKAREGGVE